MKKYLMAIAHTHWDFEWYFTRQEARVQFAFHMEEVLDALTCNDLNYYLLDGQMSILNDYLEMNPDKKRIVKKFVESGRLFIGPWYTQIDEMVTSGESAIHNLRIGRHIASSLGGSMPVGYLPDSFGQSQDIPKIYSGFGIDYAVFWRGMPIEQQKKFFNWVAPDGSNVTTANLTNGYSTGIPFVTGQADKVVREVLDDSDQISILPVGSDQRPIDTNLDAVIQEENKKYSGLIKIEETNYPEVFKKISSVELPKIQGEFIDPSTSKIHRGIYSSRYDLKSLYDQLERITTYIVQPLSALASQYGIPEQRGMINNIWKIIAMGQAHDSAGGCNSDATNRDIFSRGTAALQTAETLRDYLLRKLSISLEDICDEDLVVWNPQLFDKDEICEETLATPYPNFRITDLEGHDVLFSVLNQKMVNAAKIKRDPKKEEKKNYFLTKIVFEEKVPAMSWTIYHVKKDLTRLIPVKFDESYSIDNDFYQVDFNKDKIQITAKKLENKKFKVFIEDSGDEGDTYDYSPAYQDLIEKLTFNQAQVEVKKCKQESLMIISGTWLIAKDLSERSRNQKSGFVNYSLKIRLMNNSKRIKVDFNIDNRVNDHRMRLIISGNDSVEFSYADSQFGVVRRPVRDPHINNWREIGYHEEPTTLRPMIHFANVHSESSSLTFLTKGMKEFQVIGDDYTDLAITLFRGVGFLGRPDLIRRPGKASGMIDKYLPTPDSQLLGNRHFSGDILIDEYYDPVDIQMNYLKSSQENLSYQHQSLNQYTTPTKFFRTNKLKNTLKSQKLMKLNDCKLVVSCWSQSQDQSGFELRLYNPRDRYVRTSGTLNLFQASNIYSCNLDGRITGTLATNVKKYALPLFKPGEIKSFQICPR